MTRDYALIDWLMPVIATAVICWIFWHDVRVTASNGWGWLLIASTFLAPMAAAYWCGREHGRRRS